MASQKVPYILSGITVGVAVLGAFLYGRSKGTGFKNRIVCIDVGQGDATLVQSGTNAILIDVGPAFEVHTKSELGRDSNLAYKILLPKLHEYGISQVSAVYLSHPDADHVGGLGPVLREYPSAQVYISNQYEQFPKMQKVLNLAGAQQAQVHWTGGEDDDFGPFKVIVRCPPWPMSSEDNNGCMFMKVADGDASFVTSGDAPQATERQMIPLINWHAYALHLGHHGSKTATSMQWLTAVAPKLAIVSCGKNNPYHHPHPSTVTRVESQGIQLFRTDENGDIELDDLGGHWQVKTQR